MALTDTPILKFHPVHSPAAFIPDMYPQSLTFREVLNGDTLKQVRRQQIAKNTGHFVLKKPVYPTYTVAQLKHAASLPIPLQVTARTSAPAYPVVTHPIKNVEYDVGLSLVVLVVLYAVLTIIHDRKLDEKITY
ncbi:hypothetical protein ACJU26_09025 [Acidithiobacillus sp. M4-SHS-6]|uniref:hypothetical protein n=1 Tax=Acidithiobacillus sp. M4-SHS-6 TaxID=3383024 RepID=UPI0039BE4F91